MRLRRFHESNGMKETTTIGSRIPDAVARLDVPLPALVVWLRHVG